MESRGGGGRATAAYGGVVEQHQPPRRATAQSFLYWRRRLTDPDRFFGWLEPRVRFLWTPGFVAVSTCGVLTAAGIAWANRALFVSQFAEALRWETLVLAWLMVLATAVCHESAHGLTCKHFGGEVHEIGFLLLYLMPGLYCNVSDAWLFPEKSKRLWVTFAGAYCDLLVWALSMIVWRVALQATLLNYLAWVAASVTGIRALMNLTPLIKLDGYYLLSDLVNIPNLRQRSLNRLTAHVRWLLWARPGPPARRGDGFFSGSDWRAGPVPASCWV